MCSEEWDGKRRVGRVCYLKGRGAVAERPEEVLTGKGRATQACCP